MDQPSFENGTLNTDDTLDCDSAPDTSRNGDASSDSSDSDSDAGSKHIHRGCKVSQCSGNHEPGVHILLIKTFDIGSLWWIYSHVNEGFKFIILLHEIEQFQSLISGNWLTYQNFILGRFNNPSNIVYPVQNEDNETWELL